ncbi:hypothetical protein ACET3Z_003045 [Daucus carota]
MDLNWDSLLNKVGPRNKQGLKNHLLGLSPLYMDSHTDAQHIQREKASTFNNQYKSPNLLFNFSTYNLLNINCRGSCRLPPGKDHHRSVSIYPTHLVLELRLIPNCSWQYHSEF